MTKEIIKEIKKLQSEKNLKNILNKTTSQQLNTTHKYF